MNNPIKGKSIFVTGPNGFIGSHLVERLIAAGVKVPAMIYYNSWISKNLRYFDGNTYAK